MNVQEAYNYWSATYDSDFLEAAEKNGFRLNSFREWWHQEDRNKPPRLVSFMFEK